MSKEVDQDYQVLLENYEDALMRLVMYRVAKEDGKRLLEEAEELEHSGFEVPKELDEKCLKLIHDAGVQNQPQSPQGTEAGEGKPSPRFRWRRVGEIVAAAILVAGLLFCVAYAANEEFRVNVLNFFLEIRENGTQFFFHSDETGAVGTGLSQVSDTGKDFPFEFTYIPEGYELISREKEYYGELGIGYYCRYGNPNDSSDNFYFYVDPISEGAGLFIDTEDATISDVIINGLNGKLIQKIDPSLGKECCMYLWFDLENRLSFCYSSVGILYDKSQEIFGGIVLNGKNVEYL